MELKPEKDRKQQSDRYIECIAKGCSQRANVNGLCWEHYKISREDEEVEWN